MRRALRRRARDDGVGTDARERSSVTNGFVVPLDRRGEWYRYHHLFGQLLRNELERSEPDVVSETQRPRDGLVPRQRPARGRGRLRARRGRDGHCRRPGRRAGAAALLRRSAWRPSRSGSAGSATTSSAQYPALAVYGAWLRVLTGRPDDAERWLALADGATSAIPLSDGSATIEPWVATLRAHMMRDGVEQALADAESGAGSALTRTAPGSLDRAPRSRRCARAARRDRSCNGRPRQQPSRGAGRRRGARRSTVAQAQLALLAAKQGAWGEAGERAQAAQALVDEAGLGDYPTSAIVHVATARVALHEARQDDARAALTRAHRLRPHARPRPSLADRRGRARAHTRPSRARRGRRRPHGSRGDRAGARAPPGHGLARRRTRGSCATAWRRPPGRPAPGR